MYLTHYVLHTSDPLCTMSFFMPQRHHMHHVPRTPCRSSYHSGISRTMSHAHHALDTPCPSSCHSDTMSSHTPSSHSIPAFHPHTPSSNSMSSHTPAACLPQQHVKGFNHFVFLLAVSLRYRPSATSAPCRGVPQPGGRLRPRDGGLRYEGRPQHPHHSRSRGVRRIRGPHHGSLADCREVSMQQWHSRAGNSPQGGSTALPASLESWCVPNLRTAS